MQKLLSSALAVGMVTSCVFARAEEGPCAKIERSNVVRCAEAASLAVRAQQKGAEIAVARATVASTVLPSNPTLLVTGGRRNADTVAQGVTNWYVTLAQEVEIAGQRGLRRDVAGHELSSERKRTVAVERDVAAKAFVVYFDALAAGEQVRLARRLEDVGKTVAVATRARAESGVSSPLEADVADAAALALVRARFGAERDAASARIELTTLLGQDALTAPVDVTGELLPLPAPPEAMFAVEQQPEMLALDEQRRAADAQAAVLRRTRVPNPTFQFYVQNDGFNERVYGGGVSLPLPLPYPLGKVNRGEIAEAEARASRVEVETDLERRELRRRLALAGRSFETFRREVDAFTTERVRHAEQTLGDIGTEVTAGRLAVRDAVLAQQALIELLRGYIVARRNLCIASVELARAAGVELERGAQ